LGGDHKENIKEIMAIEQVGHPIHNGKIGFHSVLQRRSLLNN
jgi:hypothetical protein